MDVVFLSRIQFALTSMFHYIYPPMSIGLGLMMVILEGAYILTKEEIYKTATKFFTKIFALTFALGVATGLVQIFGFGTNWGRYSEFVGDIFGSALAAEGVFAFFLEAGFLGIVLFGWNRVKPVTHFVSTCLLTFGAHFSAVWIVAANSWMQTPAGYKIIGEGQKAKAVVTDFWEMVLNHSTLTRVTHVILGCWLAGIFLVISISAYYYLKKKHLEIAKISMKFSLIAAFITLCLQLLSGHDSASQVAKYQPAKLAAMEAVFKTEEYTPITVFGWVDKENKTVKGLEVPGFLSFLVNGDFKTPVKGLDQIPKDEWPPLQVVFQSYHIMVALWGLMFGLILITAYLFKKQTLHNYPLLLKGLVLSVIFPQIANQVGWITAEVGRQPWLVYGLLKTVDGISKRLTADQVSISIAMFIVIYIVLFFLFIYLLDKKIKHGPESSEDKRLDLFKNVYEKEIK
ncbi:MAG: cytochrome ubiquinol oxidase subunit I [Rhabdochlamydiaceae bacterium]